MNNNLYHSFLVGDKIYFKSEKRPYKVMAISKRYAVVYRTITKIDDAPFLNKQVENGTYKTFAEAFKYNKKIPIYYLIDFQKNIKAADNLVFVAYNYSSRNSCEKAIKDLEIGKIDLSNRNQSELSIDMEVTLNFKRNKYLRFAKELFNALKTDALNCNYEVLGIKEEAYYEHKSNINK